VTSPNPTKRPLTSDSASEPAGPELVCAAHIKLNDASMNIEAKDYRFPLGIAVTVEIKTGGRRVITHLLPPLLWYSRKASASAEAPRLRD
jgi:hemolysin D